MSLVLFISDKCTFRIYDFFLYPPSVSVLRTFKEIIGITNVGSYLSKYAR